MIALMLAMAMISSDTVEVPREFLERTNAQLHRLQAIENSSPVVSVDSVFVHVDDRGRVAVSDSPSVTVEWADLKWRGNAELVVNAVDRNIWWGTGLGLYGGYSYYNDNDRGWDVGLDYKAILIWKLGLVTGVGSEGFHIGLSYLVWRNSDIWIAPVATWHGNLGYGSGLRISF